jgi:hypothetical protein
MTLFKQKTWIKTLATHVAAAMTLENALNSAASLMDTGIQNPLI